MLTSLIAVLAHVSWLAPATAPGAESREQHAATSPVRIEVAEGRVFVSEPGLAPRYLAHGEHLDVGGQGLMEVGALGEVEIVWSNRASLRAFGPVVFEWKSAAHGDADAASDAASLDLEWQVSALGRVELESRRANVRLHLPGGFIARVHDAAFAVGSRPGGACVVEHRAGEPVLVQLPEVDRRVQPALRLAGGERVCLTRDLFPSASEDRTRHAAPWRSLRWPWGSLDATRPPVTAVAVPAEPHEAADYGSTMSSLTIVPSFELASTSLQATTEPLPPVSDPVPPPASAPVRSDTEEAPLSYREWQWRGLAHSALAAVGACAVEAAPELRARSLDDGAWLIALDARADRARWCLGDVSDVSLEPGSLIIVDAEGRLRAHWGSIHVHEATPARPRFADLAHAPRESAKTPRQTSQAPIPAAQAPTPPMK